MPVGRSFEVHRERVGKRMRAAVVLADDGMRSSTARLQAVIATVRPPTAVWWKRLVSTTPAPKSWPRTTSSPVSAEMMPPART